MHRCDDRFACHPVLPASAEVNTIIHIVNTIRWENAELAGRRKRMGRGLADDFADIVSRTVEDDRQRQPKIF